MTTSRFIRDNKQQLAAFVCLCVVFLALSLYDPVIYDPNNVLNIGKQASINLIISLGMTVVILAGGIDLSVGSLIALAVVVTARLNNVDGVNIWIALAIACACTVVFGLINGLIIQFGRVPAFVATLGTMGIARGLVLNVGQGHPGMSFPPELLYLADGSILHLPIPIWIAIVTTAAVWLLLNYTVVGRSFFALGGNEEAARLSGISIARARILPYVISAVCCAIAGIVFAARASGGYRHRCLAHRGNPERPHHLERGPLLARHDGGSHHRGCRHDFQSEEGALDTSELFASKRFTVALT
jgi:ribose/xylose/arabinose/galactoside ABC-type transport system permease subunit